MHAADDLSLRGVGAGAGEIMRALLAVYDGFGNVGSIGENGGG